MGLREDTLARYRENESASSIALTAAAGFAVGLLAGIVAGELLGDLNRDRLKWAVSRLGGKDKDPAEPVDPSRLERAVASSLKHHGGTRTLSLRAHALGNGIVELTGTAPDERSRETAGTVARTVEGVLTVVNRVLVQGVDLPAAPIAPAPRPSTT